MFYKIIVCILVAFAIWAFVPPILSWLCEDVLEPIFKVIGRLFDGCKKICNKFLGIKQIYKFLIWFPIFIISCFFFDSAFFGISLIVGIWFISGGIYDGIKWLLQKLKR